jgi:hypothetical protein
MLRSTLALRVVPCGPREDKKSARGNDRVQIQRIGKKNREFHMTSVLFSAVGFSHFPSGAAFMLHPPS